MIFILFHGAFGSSEGNWFPVLKSQLESLGQTVFAPQFPVDDEKSLKEGVYDPTEQTYEKWDKVFQPVLNSLPKNEKLCFIGHSLGCIFILREVEKYHIHLDSAIFVGAFLDCIPEEKWPYTKIIPDFQKTDFDSQEMKRLIPVGYVLYSDTDPYVPNRQSVMFGNAIEGTPIPIRSAGHMNMEVNLDEFSLVLDLCLTRLDISYSLKYNYLKQKLGAFKYVQSQKNGGSVSFNTEESMSQKLFTFQNVKKSGYATLYTGLKKLQMPHSPYMEYGREAAKRMNVFERVIMLKSKKDMADPDIMEQVRADKEAGIKISFCLHSDVKSEVPEPDFGIWDDRYVVINEFNRKTGEPTNSIIKSSTKDIEMAKKWWKIVKQKSFTAL